MAGETLGQPHLPRTQHPNISTPPRAEERGRDLAASCAADALQLWGSLRRAFAPELQELAELVARLQALGGGWGEGMVIGWGWGRGDGGGG